MDTILFTQSEIVGRKDIIIINEDFQYWEESKKQVEMFSKLSEARKFVKIDLDISSSQVSVSGNLQCNYEKGKGIFLQGLYNNNVRSGSKNFYMFFAATDDIEQAISSLQDISNRLLNYDCSPNDMEWLKEHFSKGLLLSTNKLDEVRDSATALSKQPFNLKNKITELSSTSKSMINELSTKAMKLLCNKVFWIVLGIVLLMILIITYIYNNGK